MSTFVCKIWKKKEKEFSWIIIQMNSTQPNRGTWTLSDQSLTGFPTFSELGIKKGKWSVYLGDRIFVDTSAEDRYVFVLMGNFREFSGLECGEVINGDGWRVGNLSNRDIAYQMDFLCV